MGWEIFKLASTRGKIEAKWKRKHAREKIGAVLKRNSHGKVAKFGTA